MAYCSTMGHSLSVQISYFNNLIQKHPDWTLVGIYADEGVTGTRADRPEFMRLLADCRAGKVDMICTKSITRFARNTVTLLETVRELKELGVDVFFEKENLHSTTGEGELMLTILASFAQEESRSASENQLWRVQKNFKEGKPWNCTMLGYRNENGQLIVVPEEAEIVRTVFRMYLEGCGTRVIAKHLNDNHILARRGNEWHEHTVFRVLNNYAYTGNLLLQQTYAENYLTKKRVLNEGQLPKYHWSLTQRFKDGKLLTPELLGYDRPRDAVGRYIKYGRLEIVESEAKIVRFIFDAFLAGMTPRDIATLLTDIGCETKIGNTDWSEGSIYYILRNERLFVSVKSLGV